MSPMTYWMVLVACVFKTEEPDLLIPPVDYDADVLEQNGFELCIDRQPRIATVLVSARSVNAETGCVQARGEVFVEVSADGYVPYRELLDVQHSMTHQVLLLPVLPLGDVPTVDAPSVNVPNPTIPTPVLSESEQPSLTHPMPKRQTAPEAFQLPSSSVELCVNTVPSDAFLQINGIKRPSGSCLIVQQAAEVRVEAEGYIPHKELLSIPPNAKSPVQHSVTLIKGENSQKKPAEGL